jgi:hypothetical protein
MSMRSNRRLLECMQYPFAAEVNLASRGDVIILVCWLEDRKIRELEIEQRNILRKDSEEWDKAFASYLNDMGCPFVWAGMSAGSNSGNTDVVMDCLSWLICHAVSAEYEDAAESCIDMEDNAQAASSSSKSSTNAKGESTEMAVGSDGDAETDPESTDDVEMRAAINELGSLLVMTRTAEDMNNDIGYLEKIARKARLFLTSGSLQSLQSFGFNDTALCDFPPVFETADPLLKQVATILRMLYVSDFRELQNDLNALIVLGQEYTANPRTNSALGVVGR